MHQHATHAILHAVINQCVAEDARSAFDERRDGVEDLALLRQVAGEAMDDAAERDRVERPAGDVIDRAQNVTDVRLRPITCKALGGVSEAVRLQIDQRQPWARGIESTAIQKVTRAHPDVGVIGRNVLAIVIEQMLGIAAPYVRRDHIHDQWVVKAQAELGVGLDRIGARMSRLHGSGRLA
jgi:hypothetical protein